MTKSQQDLVKRQLDLAVSRDKQQISEKENLDLKREAANSEAELDGLRNQLKLTREKSEADERTQLQRNSS